MRSPNRQRENDRAALERLVAGDSELHTLVAVLDRFNLFEALGVVRRELRHSDFLAFLLDPVESHCAGNNLARWLLEHVAAAHRSALGGAANWQADEFCPVVRREWQNIDILLTDDRQRLVVLIENKIDSGEHSDQLARYYEQVKRAYPGWQILALYLTPKGERPSHGSYLQVSYRDVVTMIEGLIADPPSGMATDVRVVLTHYVRMLRSHIVGDPELAELCRRIYRQHQRALELLFEYSDTARQQRLRDAARQLFKGTPAIIPDSSYKLDG
jgi:hypothetical protein